MRPSTWGVLAALALVLGTSNSVSDQSQVSVYEAVRTETPHSALFGLDFDGDHGVVVGIKGFSPVILESSDGGATWRDAESPSESPFLSVAIEGGKAVAVGVSGAVATAQASQKWAQVESGVSERLLGVDMNAAGLAVAVGAFGTVLRSVDWGKTWESKPPDWGELATRENPSFAEPTIYGVHVTDSGQITLAGEFGLIARSDDEGENWRILTAPKAGSPTLNAVLIGEAGKYSFAVGQEGLILKSRDAGETWIRCRVRTGHNFHDIAVSENGEVIVTGMRVMYRSTNGGKSWREIRSEDARSDWYQSVSVAPSTGRIYAVGHSGRIIQFES